MKQAVITIRGRVQGVFYRHSARIEAERCGISGWARNEPDGSVTILAEGEEAALKKFIAWCRTGPSLARVNDVQVTWGEATGEFKRFEIL